MIVGRVDGSNASKSVILRPREINLPPAASPANLTRDYDRQSVQLLDDRGNGASLIRIANGGARTTLRVVEIPLTTSDQVRIVLPNNVSGGFMRFINNDYSLPGGKLLFYNEQNDAVSEFIDGGSTLEIPANMHDIVISCTTPTAKTICRISYFMETYIGTVVFDSQPTAGDMIVFGDYVIFEFRTGINAVAAGHIPITIGANLPASITNTLTAFNTTYVAAVEPAGSLTPYYWARLITTDDLIYYKQNAEHWVLADENGIVFHSINHTFMRDLAVYIKNNDSPRLQVTKLL